MTSIYLYLLIVVIIAFSFSGFRNQTPVLENFQDADIDKQLQDKILESSANVNTDECPLKEIDYYQNDGKYILKVKIKGTDTTKNEYVREFEDLNSLLKFWKSLGQGVPNIDKCETPFTHELQRLEILELETKDAYEKIVSDCEILEQYLQRVNRGEELTPAEKMHIKYIKREVPKKQECRDKLDKLLKKVDLTIKSQESEISEDIEKIRNTNSQLGEIEKPLTSKMHKAMEKIKQHREKINNIEGKLSELNMTLGKNTETLSEITRLLKVPEFTSYAKSKSVGNKYDKILKSMDSSDKSQRRQRQAIDNQVIYPDQSPDLQPKVFEELDKQEQQGNRPNWLKKARKYRKNYWNAESISEQQATPTHGRIRERQQVPVQTDHPPEVQVIERVKKGKMPPCPTFPYEYPASLKSIGMEQIGFTTPFYELGSNRI